MDNPTAMPLASPQNCAFSNSACSAYDQPRPKTAGKGVGRKKRMDLVRASCHGETYKVWEDGSPQPHAIVKVIRASTSSHAARDFTNLRHEISRLQSSSITLARDINLIVGTVTFGSSICLVSPYRFGGSLQDYLDASMTFSAYQTASILHKIASVLACIHEQGFVHGNIKASNVLVHEDGTLQLCDFALASRPVSSGSKDCTVELVHSVGPRVLMANPDGLPDQGADIWAFGVLACELAVGGRVTAQQYGTDLFSPGCDAQLHSRQLQPFHDMVTGCLAADPLQRPSIVQVLDHVYFQDMDATQLGGVLRDVASHYRERQALRLIAHPSTSGNVPSLLTPGLEDFLSQELPSSTDIQAMEAQFVTQPSRCSSPFDLASLLASPLDHTGRNEFPTEESFTSTPSRSLDSSRPPSPPPLLCGSGSWSELPSPFSPASDAGSESIYEEAIPITFRRDNSFAASPRESTCTRSSDCLGEEGSKPIKRRPSGADLLSSVVNAFKRLHESPSTTNLEETRETADETPTTPTAVTAPTAKPEEPSTPRWSPFRSAANRPTISAPVTEGQQSPSPAPPSPTDSKPLPPLPLSPPRMVPRSAGHHLPPHPTTKASRRTSSLSIWPCAARQPLSILHRRPNASVPGSLVSSFQQQQQMMMISAANERRDFGYTALEACGPAQQSYFEHDDDTEPESKGKVKHELRRLVSNISSHLAESTAWLKRTR